MKQLKLFDTEEFSNSSDNLIPSLTQSEQENLNQPVDDHGDDQSVGDHRGDQELFDLTVKMGDKGTSP